MASDPIDTASRQGVASRPDAASQIAGLVIAIILIDIEGRIAELNNAAETLLGTSAARIAGRAFRDIVRLDEPRVATRIEGYPIDEALIARDIRLGIEQREITANLTISPLAAHPGWRIVTIAELGRELGAGASNAANVSGAPSILAHEIKNPLAAIKGAAQLITRKLAHADKPLGRMIVDEVDRIARLIDRMQQLGRLTPSPSEACNLHEAIRAACGVVRAAGLRGITIEEEFDPSLPPVLASRDALEQVLINLLSNARDAASREPEEGGRVRIRTRYVSGSVFSAIRLGRAVRLPIEVTISDDGAGLDPALGDKLFEPFVSSKAGGQGLGLALVRKLVLDMGGSVTHEREEAAGLTHFRLHLPLAQDEARSK